MSAPATTTAAPDPKPNGAPPPEQTTAPQTIPTSLYDGVSDEMRAWGQSKGYKGEIGEFGKILASLQSADRHMSSSVRIPGEDAKPEDVAAFYQKLGRPENAGAYKLPSYTLTEGEARKSDFMLGWFTKQAFERGLSEKQADSLAGEFQRFTAEFSEREEATRIAAVVAEEKSVRDAWGPEAAKNERAVLALVNAMSLEQGDIRAIVSAWGVTKWSAFATDLGSRLLEAGHGYEDSTVGTRGTFGMSREAALVEVEAIRSGKGELAEKLKRGDPAAQRRSAELHKIAYP